MKLLRRLQGSEFAFFLFLAILNAVGIAGPFLWTGRLYHDTLRSYSFFYDNLDSLHRFGEPAWWASAVSHGMPNYFFGLLGIPNLGKPAFVLMGSLAWILGRIGIALPPIHALYVVYFAVLIPFLFLLGVWLVAREVFRSRAAVRYTLTVAAFSPGALLNLSDPGVIEYSAYSLICAAAYLRFIAVPSRKRFWALCTAALLVSIAPGYHVLLSGVAPLAILFLASLVASPLTRSALRSVRVLDALVAIALVFAVATPSVLAYAQQHDDVVFTQVGGLGYPFGALKPGNPLQFLMASVPGVWFDWDWDSYLQSADGAISQLRVRSMRWGEDFGNVYIGTLGLPLAAIGLVYGRRRIRVALFVMVVLAGAVLTMFALSPVLAPFLWLFPALGTNNHFSDLLYDGVGFLLLVFAAGLGFEAAERRLRVFRALTVVFIGWNLFSLPLYLRWGQPPAALGGFVAFMVACFALLLVSAGRLPERARSRLMASGLVALTLLDVSTVCFWSVRTMLQESSTVTEAGLGRRIGSSDAQVYVLANMFVLRAAQALTVSGVEIDRLPAMGSYCTAHSYDGRPTSEDVALAFGPGRSLALSGELRSEPSLADFFAALRRAPCEVRQKVQRSYNSALVSGTSAQPSLLFVRDAWSSGWQATVNGSATRIFPAFGAFKTVVVPAGAFEVRLRFSPPWVGLSLLASYSLLLAVGLFALRVR